LLVLLEPANKEPLNQWLTTCAQRRAKLLADKLNELGQ